MNPCCKGPRLSVRRCQKPPHLVLWMWCWCHSEVSVWGSEGRSDSFAHVPRIPYQLPSTLGSARGDKRYWHRNDCNKCKSKGVEDKKSWIRSIQIFWIGSGRPAYVGNAKPSHESWGLFQLVFVGSQAAANWLSHRAGTADLLLEICLALNSNWTGENKQG